MAQTAEDYPEYDGSQDQPSSDKCKCRHFGYCNLDEEVGGAPNRTKTHQEKIIHDRQTGLEGTEKLLDFQQIAIGISNEEMVDVELGVDCWSLFQMNVLIHKVAMPFVHAVRYNGQDHLEWFGRGLCSALSLAES
jgi:hypothetical protein